MDSKITGGSIIIGFMILAIAYIFVNRYQVVQDIDQGAWVERNRLTNEYYIVGAEEIVNNVGARYLSKIVKVNSKTQIRTWKADN